MDSLLDNQDYLEKLPELLEDEEMNIDIPEKPKARRKRNEAQLAGLAKGRAKLKEKQQEQIVQREHRKGYVDYILDDNHDEPRFAKRNYKREVDYHDRYDDCGDSDSSEDEFEIIPKQKASRYAAPAAPRGRKPASMITSKKEMKEQDRLDKIENILLNLVQTQKNTKKPKVIKNTIVQIPKSISSEGHGNLTKLIKLF